jgi:hypothetical protein
MGQGLTINDGRWRVWPLLVNERWQAVAGEREARSETQSRILAQFPVLQDFAKCCRARIGQIWNGSMLRIHDWPICSRYLAWRPVVSREQRQAPRRLIKMQIGSRNVLRICGNFPTSPSRPLFLFVLRGCSGLEWKRSGTETQEYEEETCYSTDVFPLSNSFDPADCPTKGWKVGGDAIVEVKCYFEVLEYEGTSCPPSACVEACQNAMPHLSGTRLTSVLVGRGETITGHSRTVSQDQQGRGVHLTSWRAVWLDGLTSKHVVHG